MLSEWCHHVRQQRASVLFTQCNIFTKRTTSALERLGGQATFKFQVLWSIRDGKGLNKFLHFFPKLLVWGKPLGADITVTGWDVSTVIVSTFLLWDSVRQGAWLCHFWFVAKKNRDLWHFFYWQRVCKVLKCTYIYVLRMGTMLFLRDFMQVDRSVQDRLDKCDWCWTLGILHNIHQQWETERIQTHGSGG